jgi:hypothetical protein
LAGAPSRTWFEEARERFQKLYFASLAVSCFKNCGKEGNSVIRQAISCDICAAEKRQTNHWFVAYEQGGELRVSGWTSRHRLRPNSKHLCGQTCLHKLVDEYMAKSIAGRLQRAADSDEMEPELTAQNDMSLTATTTISDDESSARLITPPAAIAAEPVFHPSEPKAASSGVPKFRPDEPRAGSLGPSAYRPPSEIVTMPLRPKPILPVPAETMRHASRRWHAEAWERERERELRAIENRPGISARQRAIASSQL